MESRTQTRDYHFIWKPADNRQTVATAERYRPTSPTLSTGIEHIQLGSVLSAASQQFKNHLPLSEPNWLDVIEAAAKRSQQLGIPQRSWGYACHSIGRAAAAICVLITDQATNRLGNPVRQPAAYFQGMINRASRGELQLHKSIFSLRSRGNGKNEAA